MHVSSVTSTLCLDPSNFNYNYNWSWLVQFIVTALILGLGFLHLLRSTASKYLVVDANFDSNYNSSSSASSSSFSVQSSTMPGIPVNAEVKGCAVCGKPTTKQCSACKLVKYCSLDCQSNHWKSEHKTKCKGIIKSPQCLGSGSRSRSVALVPSSGPNKSLKLVDKVLFPYDVFVKLFNWHCEIFPPCGLLNCGNSCFANVVLQCLGHTRPLLAYLLDKGHRRDCRRNEWCFLCELQIHMEKASRSQQPFSPINILSRLPSIGGNLGYGKQEDAHEFMRFAIDTMQSVCLDEHGGEKIIHPKSQETTLIQHIFGGQLRSQVICKQCGQVSNQYENMMDLTVEIQGDATSLEECLDQFTAQEWLHGENMYQCDGCKDYVRALKHLSIHQAPNILTIALKRFESGRFGKINKRITFPDYLDLSPYMSEERDGTDKYKLYAVVVHVDMLNASFFGHYICYTKGFQGDWYRIDDSKVTRVELEEVLSQGAYMLLYSRVSARPTCLKTFEPAANQLQTGDKMATEAQSNLVHSSKSSELSNLDCSSTNIGSGKIQQLEQTLTLTEHLSVAGHELPTDDSCSTVNPTAALPASVEVLENGDAPNGCDLGVFIHDTCSGARSNENPEISGSSDMGKDAFDDMSYKASSASMVTDQATNGPNYMNGLLESKGQLEDDRSEYESHVTGNGERLVGLKRDWNSAVLDQTASLEMSCSGDRSVAEFSHQAKGKRNDRERECEVPPNDVEMDPAELNVSSNGVVDDEKMDESSSNTLIDTHMAAEPCPDDTEMQPVMFIESDNLSNVVNGMSMDVSITNTCLETPEKFSRVHGNNSHTSNGHLRLSQES